MFRPAFLALLCSLFLAHPLSAAAPAPFSIVGFWHGKDGEIVVLCEFRPNGQFEWTQFKRGEEKPRPILGRYILREAKAFLELEMFDFSVPELQGTRTVWNVQTAPEHSFVLRNKEARPNRFGTNALHFVQNAPATPPLPARLLKADYTNSIGSDRLAWTRRGIEGVHLLFESASTNAGDAWQFAACTKAAVEGVTIDDVPRKFFGHHNRDGFWEFSERWGENSLLVRQGEVWLARLSNNPTVIHALHLGAERNGMPRFTVKTLAAPHAVGSEVRPKPLDRISIDGDEYFNVTVESVTSKTVTIAHSRGLASLNPLKLTPEMKTALGIKLAPLPSQPAVRAGTAPAKSDEPLRLGKLFSMERFDAAVTSSHPGRAWREYFAGAGISIKHVVVSVLLYYFACCICLFFICRKTQHPSWFFIWFPFVKWFSLFRAAEMGRCWMVTLLASFWESFLSRVLERLNPALETSLPYLWTTGVLGLITGMLHLVGCAVWCFRICQVLGKPAWLGVLLIFPPTQLLTLGYLAFAPARHGADLPGTEVQYA